jgi:hypothetical protein
VSSAAPRVLALTVAFVVLGALAAGTEKRPPLKGVTSIRAGNYGSPSKVVQARDDVTPIVDELNELRAKPWHRGEAKLHCYASVFLFEGEKRVAMFRMRPDERVVELSMEKGQPGYTIDVQQGELPKLTKLLEEAPPARCK